jgi:hypothetical protein
MGHSHVAAWLLVCTTACAGSPPPSPPLPLRTLERAAAGCYAFPAPFRVRGDSSVVVQLDTTPTVTAGSSVTYRRARLAGLARSEHATWWVYPQMDSVIVAVGGLYGGRMLIAATHADALRGRLILTSDLGTQQTLDAHYVARRVPCGAT